MMYKTKKVSWVVVVGLVMNLLVASCGGGGGSTPVVPRPGHWSGNDISFDVNGTSTEVTDLSAQYSGHASGTYCSFDYDGSIFVGTSMPITNGSFSYTSPLFEVTGTFSNEESVEGYFSWSMYDSYCDAEYSGSQPYTAQWTGALGALSQWVINEAPYIISTEVTDLDRQDGTASSVVRIELDPLLMPDQDTLPYIALRDSTGQLYEFTLDELYRSDSEEFYLKELPFVLPEGEVEIIVDSET